jgi:hypothetical protein
MCEVFESFLDNTASFPHQNCLPGILESEPFRWHDRILNSALPFPIPGFCRHATPGQFPMSFGNFVIPDGIGSDPY